MECAQLDRVALDQGEPLVGRQRDLGNHKVFLPQIVGEPSNRIVQVRRLGAGCLQRLETDLGDPGQLDDEVVLLLEIVGESGDGEILLLSGGSQHRDSLVQATCLGVRLLDQHQALRGRFVQVGDDQLFLPQDRFQAGDLAFERPDCARSLGARLMSCCAGAAAVVTIGCYDARRRRGQARTVPSPRPDLALQAPDPAEIPLIVDFEPARTGLQCLDLPDELRE